MRVWVRLTSLSFTGRLRGQRFHVIASVGVAGGAAARFGDGSQVFAPAGSERHATPSEVWSHQLDVDPEATVRLEIALRSVAGGELDRIVHEWPANRHAEHVSLGGRQFVAELATGLPDRAAGQRTGVVYARRHAPGATAPPLRVAAPRVLVHAEIDPVMPPPTRPELVRPAFVEAPGTRHEPISRARGAEGPFDGINPAVIPAWSGSGDPDGEWRRRWAATVMLSDLWYRGPFHAGELEWSSTSLEGGAQVGFFDSRTRGTDVVVFGRGEGEVRIEVKHRGRTLSMFRALVRPVVRVPMRLVRLVTSDWQSIGRTTAERWSDIVAMTNRYLRQLALELVPATADPAREVRAPAADVIDVPRERFPEIAARHALDGHVTFVAMGENRHEGQGITVIVPGNHHPGAAVRTPVFWPGTIARAEVDRGTPSSSWIAPCGVPPNGASAPTSIDFFREVNPQGHTGAVVFFFPEVSLWTAPAVGSTIAHEFLHSCGLCHRGPEDDGIAAGVGPNLMTDAGGASDVDIAQAKVVWQSYLVRSLRT